MSRSYKKSPYGGDSKDKFYKNYSNRVIRRDKYNKYNGNSYKRKTCSWNICDYWSSYTFEEWWDMIIKAWYEFYQYRGYPYPDEKEEYKKWYKHYKMK